MFAVFICDGEIVSSRWNHWNHLSRHRRKMMMILLTLGRLYPFLPEHSSRPCPLMVSRVVSISQHLGPNSEAAGRVMWAVVCLTLEHQVFHYDSRTNDRFGDR